tara:strand:- start:37218 stop:38405 length:1188 start_codon:yes stop_codon:yes gene_type:complete
MFKLKNKTKITVVGAGYVGMSLAVLLSQHNDVVILEIDISRMEKINNKETTIADKEIESFLVKKKLNLTATVDKKEAYKNATFIVIGTPTNYNDESNKFDTSSVDKVVKEALNANQTATIVIKSTVPVGYTEYLRDKFNTDRIIFSPEFLREGNALKDNLYPSRIIMGSKSKEAVNFVSLLLQGAVKKNIETLYMKSTEAEAVKLFANSYLAMRISFFNELDSYALEQGIDTKNIIEGVCLDQRIGKGYNNPSFGYGGYCLPKDVKQLLANYEDVPQNLIRAIVSSNSSRKDFIAEHILKQNPKTVGFYRLTMKEGSDNFRSSAIQGIIDRIISRGIRVIIFEPLLNSSDLYGLEVINDLESFKFKADIIVANRFSNELSDISSKVFTRDIFRIN